MPQTYDELAAQARELTNEDRVRLAQALLSSLSLARSHEVERCLGSFGARLEELEARLIDGESH